MNVKKVENQLERETVQIVHMLEKDKMEMNFQKGRNAAQILFDCGLISQKERDSIVRHFRDIFHPDLESIID